MTAGGEAPAAVPHLILIGLPGAGKTTAGEGLALRLGRPFLDFDREIERRAGRTVAQLFAAQGEDHFRRLEHELTEELVAAVGTVLSPGGGWVMNAGNVALLRPPGRIIHLEVSPGTALARLRAGGGLSVRPLLSGDDPLAALARLGAQRAASYRSADLIVDTEDKTLQQVIEELVVLAEGPVAG